MYGEVYGTLPETSGRRCPGGRREIYYASGCSDKADHDDECTRTPSLLQFKDLQPGTMGNPEFSGSDAENLQEVLAGDFQKGWPWMCNRALSGSEAMRTSSHGRGVVIVHAYVLLIICLLMMILLYYDDNQFKF